MAEQFEKAETQPRRRSTESVQTDRTTSAPEKQSARPVLESTAPKGLNGVLSSPDGHNYMSVENGIMKDQQQRVVGVLNEDGKVLLPGQKLSTSVSSLYEGWTFAGHNNGQARLLLAGPAICDGRVFIPDQQGKPHDYSVTGGMLIDASTRKQIGLFVPPTEQPNGTLSGGCIQYLDGRRMSLEDVAGLVFDVSLSNESGLMGRALRGAVIRDAGHNDTLNLSEALKLQNSRFDADYAAEERLGEKNWVKKETKKILNYVLTSTFSPDQKAANSAIARIDSVLTTGRTDVAVIHDIYSDIDSAKKSANGDGEQMQLGAAGLAHRQELPAIDATNEGTINGVIRIDNHAYSIKSGKLFELSYENGTASQAEQSSGQLGEGYIVTRPDGSVVELQHHERVLMQFTIGDNDHVHQLIGMGHSRMSDGFGYVPGGLMPMDAVLSDSNHWGDEPNHTTIADYARRYDLTDLPPELIHENPGLIREVKASIAEDLSDLKSESATLFSEGLRPGDLTNNQLDSILRQCERRLFNIGATVGAPRH